MLSRINRAILLLTAAGIPIAFFGRLEDDPFSVTKLALLVAGISLGLAIFCAQRAQGARVRAVRSIAIPALALTVPLAVSWAFTPYREWALWGQYGRFNGLLPYVAFALLGVLLVAGFWGHPETLIRALSIAGGVVGAYATIQTLGIDPLWSPGLDSGSPFPPSTIGHYNFVGGFLAIALPASVYRWLGDEQRGWEGMVLTVLTTTGLILSNSQGGWVAALAGLAVVVGSFVGRRWVRARNAGRWAAALVAAGVIFSVAISAGSSSPMFGGTAKSRGLLWGTALEMGADHPLVGRGPAAYAVEGVRYRDLDYILLERNTRADDPHSVPLSFWANAGVLGLAGFLALGWWIWRAGTRAGPNDHLRDAFFAACVAYLVQSLVSIDVLALRAGLWMALAGLAMTSMRDPKPAAGRVARPFAVRAGLVALAIGIAAGGTWYSLGLFRAHTSFAQANKHFQDDRVDLGIERSEAALRFRFEPWYLATYGRQLSAAALRAGPEGETLIERMEENYAYLDHFPDSFGFTDAAQGFHDWAHFEPNASEKALIYLAAAERIDPANPDIDLRLAEALIRAGRYDEARSSLEAWPAELRSSASYWGALAIARLLDGDPRGAEDALLEGKRLDASACRIIGAGEVLQRYESGATVSPDQDFLIRYNCSLGSYYFITDMAERAART